jgi:hypothetical protein
MVPALRVLSVCLAWAVCSLPSRATAQPVHSPAACATALAGVPDADPLEFARAASRCGDRELLAWIASAESSSARFAAIRASPFLVAPERALPTLVSLLLSRDSLLAPAAARAALEIAGDLTPDLLVARESPASELSAALSTLQRASETPHLRVELRMMAARAAALLEAAGVPST